MQATQQQPSVDTAPILKAIDVILSELGEPTTDLHRQAFAAYKEGDSARVKRLSTLNLSDSYLRCLGYLVSAVKNPALPTIDTLLAESARAAADFAKERTLDRLNKLLSSALG
jgi:hypothetical protein